MTDPIVVDIGAAMTLLESNLGIAAKMNELAFGTLAADQLAAREALILELGEALERALENFDSAVASFAGGDEDNARQALGGAHLFAKEALEHFRDFVGAPAEVIG